MDHGQGRNYLYDEISASRICIAKNGDKIMGGYFLPDLSCDSGKSSVGSGD